MTRRESALTRHIKALEREAKEECLLAMAEYAPPLESVMTARQFSLITGAGGLGLDRYEAAGMAGAMTLMVYARRIAHVEAGVGT